MTTQNIESNKRWKRAKRKAEKDIAELLENDLLTIPTAAESSGHFDLNNIPTASNESDLCESAQILFDSYKTSTNFNLSNSQVQDCHGVMEPLTSCFNEIESSSLNSEAFMGTYCDDLPASSQIDSPVNNFESFPESDRESSSDDRDSSFDENATEDDPDSSLRAALVVWALTHKIGRNALTDLLHILRDHNHSNLPLSSKTLMKTPRSTVNLFTSLGAGLFWYYGILQCLIPRLNRQYVEGLKNLTVVIDIFVDGVSPYKSVKKVLWPICGCLAGSWDIFIIGMWCGQSKEPRDLQMFFEEFIKEALELKYGFTHLGYQLKLKIRRIIADAPARTWIKNVNQHGSYFACERCTAVGIWLGNRVTYPAKEVTEERTDKSLAQCLDKRYHKGTSPLTKLNIDLISQIPLEPLHLLWLGVTKRILMNLLTTRRNPCQYKFSDSLKSRVDRMSQYIAEFYPSDFARKPRKWTDYTLFKGTDYRRIALYDGLILLKTPGVNPNVYHNFCIFSCAMRILSDPELIDNFADDAQMLLEKFISSSISIYGKTFNVYNVHHLKHLTEDCKRHGDLESFSAFKFESHLEVLKRLLRAPGRTLPQIVCRLLEEISNRPKAEPPLKQSIEVCMPCDLPDSLNHLGKGFEKIIIHDKKIKMSAGKSFFLSTERKTVQLLYIIETSETYLLVGQSFKKRSEYFKYPIPSSALDIYEVEELSGVQSCWTVNQVKKKCVVIPLPSENQPLPKGYLESKCLALPMCHGGDEYH